jgi:hypothetical protein
MEKLPNQITEIWINRSALDQTKIVSIDFDAKQLQTDEVLLQVDSFGFSANNITYAIFGEKMAYWGFFPAAEGWGIVPVWGFATVLASNHAEVKVGEKVFGYLPMASHLVIQAGKNAAHGFYDIHAKRKSISPVYDYYQRCAVDPGYRADKEAWQLNYRPLFLTSFVLDDYVGEALQQMHAQGTAIGQIVLTSASSKTAYGAAHLLMKHRVERGLDYQVVGLTSPNNVAFTDQLGCYDEVLAYSDTTALSADTGTWVLDFSGNKTLLLNLQQSLHAKLLLIGSTDVEAQHDKPQGQLHSEFFFAPSQVKKRSAEWGQEGFALRYAKAWQGFNQLIEQHISEAHYRGAASIETMYKHALAGQLNIAQINTLKF